MLANRPAAAGPFAHAARRTWDTLIAPVRGLLRREAVYRELAELDDRMLADIGLHRGDIQAVAAGVRPTIER